MYSISCDSSPGPWQSGTTDSTTLEVVEKTVSTSIPSVRPLLPADPSVVPGLGLDTVLLDLHTPDLAQLLLPVPGTLEAVVARSLTLPNCPGWKTITLSFVWPLKPPYTTMVPLCNSGGVIEPVGGKEGGSEDRLCLWLQISNVLQCQVWSSIVDSGDH